MYVCIFQKLKLITTVKCFFWTLWHHNRSYMVHPCRLGHTMGRPIYLTGCQISRLLIASEISWSKTVKEYFVNLTIFDMVSRIRISKWESIVFHNMTSKCMNYLHAWGQRAYKSCGTSLFWRLLDKEIASQTHTWYLSFFFHEQNFWKIKFTPKKRVNYDKIHSKLPIFCVITAKHTVNCQFFALNL